MKKIILMMLLTSSPFSMAQTYELNIDAQTYGTLNKDGYLLCANYDSDSFVICVNRALKFGFELYGDLAVVVNSNGKKFKYQGLIKK